jgi:hypothetical protein
MPAPYGGISNRARFGSSSFLCWQDCVMDADGRKRQRADLHSCPTCSTTVFWENEGFPGQVTVAIGNFGDPTFRQRPLQETRHPWVSLPPDTPPMRAAKQG